MNRSLLYVLPIAMVLVVSLGLPGHAAPCCTEIGVVEEPMEAKLRFYRDGQQYQVLEDKAQWTEETLITALEGIHDRLRLGLFASDIEEMLAADTVWELTFPEDRKYDFGLYGTHLVRRLFAPLTGRLAPSPESDMIVLVTESPEGGLAVWTAPMDSEDKKVLAEDCHCVEGEE